MSEDPISVLIVDDSAMMRNLIGRIVESHDHLAVAGKAMNGVFALQKMPRLEPDVIVLDIEMPEMNGIEFLKEKNKMGNDIPVIVLSAVATKGAKVTMEALSLGASDFITKPSGSVSHNIQSVGERLIQLILAFGQDYRRRRGPRQTTRPAPAPIRKPIESPAREVRSTPAMPIGTSHWEKFTPVREPHNVQILAIGISTGGPNALRKVFSAIDPGLSVPVIVVQHMPAGFTEEFAKSLDRICPLEVKEASDGDLLKPGRILIAPGDYHVQVSRKSLGAVVNVLSKDPVNGHRPSVDVLFESVAKEYKNEAIAVIMTGMGKDGARQIGKIYSEGGMTLAQDEETSIVYGMPKVAIEHGYIREIIPLTNMAERISTLTKELA